MSTQPVSSLNSLLNPNSATSGAAAGSGGSNGLGGLTMSDFLTLMTAQLQHQDPLNPTDSNQFLNQLSELSTVQGISQLNTSMSTLSNSMLSSQAVASANLVGRGVLAPASAANFTSGSTLSGAVQVPSGATSVVVSITDASGALVNQFSVPAVSGLQSFSWNGTAANGAHVPSGVYSVSATAQVGGAGQAASTLLNGTISSVSLDASGTGVTLNTPQLGPVALGSVQQID